MARYRVHLFQRQIFMMSGKVTVKRGERADPSKSDNTSKRAFLSSASWVQVITFGLTHIYAAEWFGSEMIARGFYIQGNTF